MTQTMNADLGGQATYEPSRFRIPVMVDFDDAMLGGFIATMILTLILNVANSMNWIHFDLAKIVGTMMGLTGEHAYWYGMAGHFFLGTVVFALVYAAAFRAFNLAPTWGTGALFGFLHWIAFGVFLGLLPAIDPVIRSGQMNAPGWFGMRFGWVGIVGGLALHLVYGMFVGGFTNPRSNGADLNYSPTPPVA